MHYPGCQRLFMRGFRFRSSLNEWRVIPPSAEHVSACGRRNEAPRRTREKTSGTQGSHALQIDNIIRKWVVIWQRPLFFRSPSHRTLRALFFFLPSPPTAQRGHCGGENHCFKKRYYSILGSNHFTMRLTANNLIIYFEARKDLLVEHYPFLENEQSSIFI